MFSLVKTKKMTIKTAAAKAGMCESSAHKYLRLNKRPSELKRPPKPSRRPDAFAGVWSECVQFLEADPKLEAKALFEYLLDKYPDQFKPKQLRTFGFRLGGRSNRRRCSLNRSINPGSARNLTLRA